MADIVSGQRVGGFIVFQDEDGLRHAVRCGAILASSAMQMSGNRVVIVRVGFDDVLGWFG